MMTQPRCSVRQCIFFEGIAEMAPGDETSQVPVCAAFPKGIPADISYGENKHLTVQPGQDAKITYEGPDK